MWCTSENYQVTFSIEEEYTPEMADPTSQVFIDIATEIQQAFEVMFTPVTGIQNLVVVAMV